MQFLYVICLKEKKCTSENTFSSQVKRKMNKKKKFATKMNDAVFLLLFFEAMTRTVNLREKKMMKYNDIVCQTLGIVK